MNIPLTQRQLLTALKHVCGYLKYRVPKRMVGDAKTWAPTKAIFFRSSGVVQHLAGLVRIFLCLAEFGVYTALPVSKAPRVPFPAGIRPFQFETF